MSNKYMKNEQYEVLENKNGDCYIKDIIQNKYFYRSAYFLSKKGIFSDIKMQKIEVIDIILILLTIMTIFPLFYLFINYGKIYHQIDFNTKMYWLSIGYLLINLVLHELGHILTLSAFGRKIGKIRFRFNFIFPAISVDTSDSYILTRTRRFFVYYAGIMVNIYVCFFTLLLFKTEAYLIRSVLWAIVINLIPIGWLKSDGYHIFVSTILNVQDMKKQNSLISIVSRHVFIILSIIFLLFSAMKCLGLSL